MGPHRWRLARLPPFSLIPRCFLRSEMTRFAHPAALPDAEVAPVPIRLPGQFHSLREVAALSNTPFRLNLKGLEWCSLNQTGGLITREDFPLVCAGTGASERHAAECERTGAWHDARYDCGSEFCLGPVDADGWIVHDFYRYDVPEDAVNDAGALERRRASDKERKRRERERKAAAGTEPTRKRGRPPKANKPVKPQMENASRDRSRDGITDLDRSDLDLDFNQGSVGQSVNQVEVRNAREPKPGTPEFRLQVRAEFAGATGDEIDDATADAITADVLGSSKKPVGSKLGYVLKSVRNDPDPRGRWLPWQPPRERLAAAPEWCGDPSCSQRTHRREDPGTGADLGPCPRCGFREAS